MRRGSGRGCFSGATATAGGGPGVCRAWTQGSWPHVSKEGGRPGPRSGEGKDTRGKSVFPRSTCPGPVLTAGDPTLSCPPRGHQGHNPAPHRVAHTTDRSGGGGQTPCPSKRVALGQSADVPVNSRRTPWGAQGPQEPRGAVGARPRGGSLRAGRTALRAARGVGGLRPQAQRRHAPPGALLPRGQTTLLRRLSLLLSL